MAKMIEIIIGNLPSLVADRADARKLETAIRYVGDIIFDASRDRSGAKAQALARVLSSPASQEEAQSRDAILTLFQEGYLDRYVDYSALRDIARAAGISPVDPQMDPFRRESATESLPNVVSLTQVLNTATARGESAAAETDRAESIKKREPSAPLSVGNEPMRRMESASETTSHGPADRSTRPGTREPKQLYAESPQRLRPGSEVKNVTKDPTTALEITSLDRLDHRPPGLKNTLDAAIAETLSETKFPCLTGFVPKVSSDQTCLDWANPVTADSFKDLGDRLVSASPSRLTIRAMLELAQARNWASVAVKGSLRVQAFAEATAAELNSQVPISSGRGTTDRARHQLRGSTSVRSKRRRLGRLIGVAATLIVLLEIGFGAIYIYSRPELQARLGLAQFISGLVPKHAVRVAKVQAHPLDLLQLTLALATRKGATLEPPRESFTDTDLTNARYLKWNATFKNALAGLEGRSETVEAKFFDPNGLQIASSSSQIYVGPSQKIAEFSGVALMPTMTGKAPGQYKVALFIGDLMLGQRAFTVTRGLAPRNKAAEEAGAVAAAKAEPVNRKEEAERLAMLGDLRRKPLELREIEFLNATQAGFTLSGPKTSFSVHKVVFVEWKVTFYNRLYGKASSGHSVEATYIAPGGRILGSVTDLKNVSSAQKTARFTGRVGNARGGAFLPGVYTVNFRLDGRPLGQRKFRVVGNSGVSETASGTFSEKACTVCYDASNGHYYQYVSHPGITWKLAKTLAAAMTYKTFRGYLATVTSREEFDFINHVVFSSANFPSGIPANVYVGGRDAGMNGTWKWVTGPEGAEAGGTGLVFYSGRTVRNGLTAPWDPHDKQGQIDGSTGEYCLYLNSWYEPGFAVTLGSANRNIYSGGNSGYLVEYSPTLPRSASSR
jgi:Large polyvalent protein-associated domain 7